MTPTKTVEHSSPFVPTILRDLPAAIDHVGPRVQTDTAKTHRSQTGRHNIFPWHEHKQTQACVVLIAVALLPSGTAGMCNVSLRDKQAAKVPSQHPKLSSDLHTWQELQ